MLSRMRIFAAAIACCAIAAASAIAQQAPTEWDGLSRVESTRFKAAYLAPGADFRPYTKVMLDPTEAAFARNWQRDYNSSTVGLGDRITDEEARNMLQAAQTGLHDAMTRAYTAAGWEIVTTPAADVLRVRTAVANLRVTAPDTMSPGITRTYSRDAGQATLVIEARDSMSGAVLGRAVDPQSVDDSGFMLQRNRASNRSEFNQVFERWSNKSVEAFNALRALPAPAVAASGSD